MLRRLMFALTLFATPLMASDSKEIHEVDVTVTIKSPYSQELQNLIDSIPDQSDDATDWQEWKASFVDSMQRLIDLVESNNVENSSWTINVHPEKP